MQYIKHYYVDEDNNTFCCETTSNPKYKRHPWKEYTGLNVKIWLTDSDGVDVCLAELPDETSVSTVADANSGKNRIQVLTETQYNSVATPYFQSQTLSQEAREARDQNDEVTAQAKESAAATKLSEATTAIRAL